MILTAYFFLRLILLSLMLNKQATMEYEILKENYQYKFDIIYILTTTQLFEYRNNKLNSYNINLDLFRT